MLFLRVVAYNTRFGQEEHSYSEIRSRPVVNMARDKRRNGLHIVYQEFDHSGSGARFSSRTCSGYFC